MDRLKKQILAEKEQVSLQERGIIAFRKLA